MVDLTLPQPPMPAGCYSPVVIRRGVGFVSGQFPICDGALAFRGRVGIELTVEQAREACRIAALNVLAHIAAATDMFSNLEGLFRLDGYIASAEGFLDQPTVLDEASILFASVLGERGRHARTAFAVAHLPLDAPLELSVTFATR